MRTGQRDTERVVYLINDFTSFKIFCDDKNLLRHRSALAIRHIDSFDCDIHRLRREERIIPYLIFSPTLMIHTPKLRTFNAVFDLSNSSDQNME